MAAEHEEALLVATPSWKGRAMGAVILILAIVWPLYREGGPDLPLVPMVAWGLFGLALGLHAWTYRVTANEEGLSIHRWWRPPTRIAWHEIEEVGPAGPVRSLFTPGLELRLSSGRRVRIGRYLQGFGPLPARIRARVAHSHLLVPDERARA